MRVHRGTCARGLSAAVLGAALAGLSSLCWSAEFYSWIDPSGMMVMTDDLSRVPSATQRSAVSIHRFLDHPPVPPSSREQSEPNQNAGGSPQATLSQSAGADQAQPLPVDPALLDLPKVLLESPDEMVKAEYVWVPLLSPIYLGASPVPGFWCLRTVTDPGSALKDYVSQHRGQVVVGGSPWRYGPAGIMPSNARPDWGRHSQRGNPFQDQVMRMQRALSGRSTLRGQSAPAVGPTVIGSGLTSGRR